MNQAQPAKATIASGPAPDATAAMPERVARIATFTHDTYGLGHVRRTLRIVRALASEHPAAALFVISGSPALHVLGDLPPHADVLKIPTIAKAGSRLHQPSHLPIARANLSQMRTRLIHEALDVFAPDLFLVDNFPLGSQGELLPALQALRRTPARLVLGLRDILDAPEVITRDWARQGMYDVLERYFDRVLVYGSRDVFDVADAYRLPPAIAHKLVYCGYITDRPASISNAATRLGVTPPFILVAGGGGGDGFPLLRAFLEAIPDLPTHRAVVVTGPLMSRADQRQLRDLVIDPDRVVLREYVPDLSRYFADADLVVSMCGYNSAAEIVANSARALVVPRTWAYGERRATSGSAPEWEQLLRARALAALNLVDLLEPADLTAARLAESMQDALARPRRKANAALDLDGLAVVTREITSLLP
jgi:predicted glycosyltransferase